MVHLLFVYGSLRSEFDNVHARRLRAESEFVGPAAAPGSIFLIDPYPGYRRTPEGTVCGEVYRLTDPAATLAHLDEYEGAEYRRVSIQLSTPTLEAWVYEYTAELPAGSRIASGDFTRR